MKRYHKYVDIIVRQLSNFDDDKLCSVYNHIMYCLDNNCQIRVSSCNNWNHKYVARNSKLAVVKTADRLDDLVDITIYDVAQYMIQHNDVAKIYNVYVNFKHIAHKRDKQYYYPQTLPPLNNARCLVSFNSFDCVAKPAYYDYNQLCWIFEDGSQTTDSCFYIITSKKATDA